LDEAREIVDIATVQNRYNVANREHEAVLQACESAGIGFIPWGPLYGVEDDAARSVLASVGDAHDASAWQIALAWLLAHSDVTLPIPGTASVAHLEANVAASHLSLRDAALDRLDSIDPQ